MIRFSIKGFFGETIHYDSKGKQIGETWGSFIPGVYNHYNARGKNIGYSIDNGFGLTEHFDSCGNEVGYSVDDGLVTNNYLEDSSDSVSIDDGFMTVTSKFDNDNDNDFIGLGYYDDGGGL